MNAHEFTLFFSFVLFSGLNFLLNLKSGDKFLKLFTYFLNIVAIIAAAYLLWIAFIKSI